MLRTSQIKKIQEPGFITSDGRFFKRPKATIKPNQKRQPVSSFGEFVFKHKYPVDQKILRMMMGINDRVINNNSANYSPKKTTKSQVEKRKLRHQSINYRKS